MFNFLSKFQKLNIVLKTDLLMRGIAIHHSGLDKSYRKAVERLFRLKKIQKFRPRVNAFSSASSESLHHGVIHFSLWTSTDMAFSFQ